MELTWISIIILICSGIIVGFINTLAGGGTVISISVFMFFGLPPLVANGTNRIAIIFQNLTAVAYFQKNKCIDWHRILHLGIPIVLGSLTGAFIAGYISNRWFHYIFAGVIVIFGISMLLNPNKYIHERTDLVNRKVTPLQYMVFFLLGIYGGFVHVGIGYLLLAVLVLMNGYDLLKANVLKNVLVLSYVPFSLLIYALQGNVCWSFGLIHAIGNIIGAGLAARLAIKKGAPFIRYIVLILIVIVILQIFGIITPNIKT
ncbi:MAG: sulfite exporter TauE/SafE family protein [Bacteroidetes bacterium]|nr:sulfite exporter TauE/SafE family protein [Bacteroidota bacterium]MCL1968294.1 sulfite exporter TauE/SafE family protein [Bacteroidota bacterium]